MAATIQTIVKPTRARGLDTSGNNNHAQIYSGRALEFDGVSDYFNCTLTSGVTSFANTEEWTLATWIYFEDGSDYQHFIGKDADTKPAVMMQTSYISIRAANAKYYRFPNGAALQDKTWYRLVIVASSSSTLTCYLNGVQNGDLITTSTDVYTGTSPNLFSSTEMAFNGWGCPYYAGDPVVRNHHFEGMMSDGQVWNSAWTAADAEYDYLNPEQLALNRGGTSLTNSNLKLWYPMNEGHRGNQSYVLDASNTGLNDEMIAISDLRGYTSAPAGWSNTTLGTGDSITWGANGVRYYNVSGDVVSLKYTADVVQNTTYKLVIVVSDYSGNRTLKMDNSAGFAELDGVGTHTFYINAKANVGSFINFYRGSGTTVDLTIESMSLIPINDKNNATTAFYGDDLFDSGVGDYGDSTGGWTPDGNNTVDNNDTALRITFVDDDDGARLDLNNAEDLIADLVVGRIYRLTFTYKINQVTGSNVILQINTGDGTFVSTAGLNSTSYATLTKDFTATHATGAEIKFNNMDSGDILHVKDFKLQEIGIASGWTDADQQLDIPQTALQSYNQLGWFQGDGPNSKITDDEGFTPGDYTTVSFWFFNNENRGSTGLFDCIDWSGGTNFRMYINSSYKLQCDKLKSSAATEGFDASLLPVLSEGKWYHVIFTIPKDAGTNNWKIMINGQEYTDSSEHAMPVSSRNIYLGHSGGLDYPYFLGTMTEVAIYSDMLTDAEKLELYNNGMGQDATTVGDNLVRYWRNQGAATWTNLANPGTADGVPTNTWDESMLITAGVDSSRDSQGFLMNRQRTTNSLNQTSETSNTYGADLGETSTFAAGAAFSITLWAKPTDITDNRILGNTGDDYIQFKDTDEFRIKANNTIFNIGISAPTDWVVGEWVHISIVRNTSNVVTLYLNGVAQTDSTPTAAQPFDYRYIGGVSDSKFRGELDDICIYSDELEATEVTRNYNAGKRSHR